MKRVHYIEWVSSVEDVGGGCSHFAQFIVRDRNPKHAKWNANVKTQVHLFLFRGGLFRDGPKHGICRSM